MNILQRFGQWMTGTQEAAAAKTLTMPAWWSDIRSTGLGQGGQFGFDDASLVAAMRSNVWAYNSVKARMTMVATPKLKLYKGEGDEREEIESHPVLDLLKFVNPINLNQRSLMRGIEQQLAIFGRCIIHKNRGSTTPVELFILPKTYVEIIPDSKVFIGGYRWIPTNEIIDPKDIIDIYYPSADGSIDAESPTAIALGAINRYNTADRAQTAIDKRGGQKGGLVVHPADEIDEDFERIKTEWDRRRADPDKAGSDMHVPHGTEYQGDAFSAVEMQREERINRLAKEIMAGYGIPPAAAGDYTDASVLANAAVQMKAAWDLFGLEELAFIAEGLTNSLLWAEYKDARSGQWYLSFDTSTINALNEDVDARTNRAIVAFNSQIASLNEARELAGFDAVDDPNANRVPLPALPEPAPAPVDASTQAPTDQVAPTDASIQQQALNGAQISSLVEVVQAVSTGDLPAESAIEIVSMSFPAIDIDTILTMIDAAVGDQIDQAGQGDPEIDALSTEVDDLLAEINATPTKAVGRPEKGDRDGDGIFNEGSKPAGGDAPKVSPVTGRSLAPVGGSAEDKKKAAKDKEKAAKKVESDRQKAIKKDEAAKERERKKAEAQKQREQKKAESAKQKEQSAAAKKQAQLDQLDAEGTKLQAAYDSIKDRADVDPKLKQKVIDTLAKIKAKRDSLASGQSEATSGVLQDIARIPTKAFDPISSSVSIDSTLVNAGSTFTTIPIIDPVGRMAVDEAGVELGTVTKVARFNTHGDIVATAEDPVIYIGDKVFKASTVKVVLNG